jgi:hypothetical protein
MAFTTGTRKKDPIKFSLDGEDFEFIPPKSAKIFLEMVNEGSVITLTKETFDWLGDGLGEEKTARLVERLKDPEDEFDTPNLEAILAWLQKQVAGRPTT